LSPFYQELRPFPPLHKGLPMWQVAQESALSKVFQKSELPGLVHTDPTCSKAGGGGSSVPKPQLELLKPNEEENKEVEGLRGGNSGSGLGQVLVALNVLTWAPRPPACISFGFLFCEARRTWPARPPSAGSCQGHLGRCRRPLQKGQPCMLALGICCPHPGGPPPGRDQL